ncbi:SDR family oxidoreductase [Cryomorpha ignava]|uniref:SDR family oxidoreductase n=1 Tax=Cryomorpha ignava TaxID=101383 RepID=A0A7K3WPD8_9FLAO|nr:SDR family oxidoreductase [Cryomorpha ignava]NEN22752.1 SDR family oxidoreductase [Cryomorpha ignava]
MNKKENRTVCITGCGRGLGFELIQSFLNDTDLHIAAISRNGDVLKKKLESSLSGNRVTVIEADISTNIGRDRIYNELKNLPELGYLVHNAGKLLFKPFKDIGEKELTDIYTINVFAPFLLTQKLIPLMDSTHTISISSVGGVEGSMKFAGLSAYSTSKAALNCLTEMLSEEFKETANVFNCLALGSVDTEMFNAAFPGATASTTTKDMADYIVSFAVKAPKIMRGKIISLSVSNP